MYIQIDNDFKLTAFDYAVDIALADGVIEGVEKTVITSLLILCNSREKCYSHYISYDKKNKV